MAIIRLRAVTIAPGGARESGVAALTGRANLARAMLHPVKRLVLVVILSGCGAAKIEAPKGATGPVPDPVRPAVDAGLALPGADAADTAAIDAAPVSAGTCAAESWNAEGVPVDLVFVIDQSPSMFLKIGDQTKWALAKAAMRGFLADPRSGGLGVGLQFFPIRPTAVPCASDNDCGFPLACSGGACKYVLPVFPSCAPADYQRLALEVSPLPAARAQLEMALERMPNDYGSSPLGPAAQGAIKALRARLASQPGRRGAVVLVTDGVPSGCVYGWTGVEQITAGLQAEQRQSPAIPVYVIGLYSDSEQEDVGGPAALAAYASAGGTGMPFIVKPPGDVTRAFLDALDHIRAASVPCEYVIPASKAGSLDFAKVNLHAKLPTGEADVPYVGRMDRCQTSGGGWYYDVEPSAGTPSRVIACPGTCQAFKSAVGQAQVSLTFGCKTVSIE
jgi:hypothetical protein